MIPGNIAFFRYHRVFCIVAEKSIVVLHVDYKAVQFVAEDDFFVFFDSFLGRNVVCRTVNRTAVKGGFCVLVGAKFRAQKPQFAEGNSVGKIFFVGNPG